MTTKKEALERLDSIEKEQKQLRAILEAPEPRKLPTTLKEACKNQGVDYREFLEECDKVSKSQSGFKKLELIIKDVRGNWKPTVENTWYFPWMRRNKKSLSFDYGGYHGDDSYYVVPASLAVENPEQAEYSGKTFESEWTEYLSPE